VFQARAQPSTAVAQAFEAGTQAAVTTAPTSQASRLAACAGVRIFSWGADLPSPSRQPCVDLLTGKIQGFDAAVSSAHRANFFTSMRPRSVPSPQGERLWAAFREVPAEEIGYLCKAPLALLEAGREVDARSALEKVSHYISAGGRGPCPSVYARGALWQLPWLWILWAACELGHDKLADACFVGIRAFSHPLTASGLVRRPYRNFRDIEADFFATAALCKAALLRKSLDLAIAAGDSLLRALTANELNMRKRRQFCIRSSFDQGLLDQTDKFYIVSQDTPDQLYHLLGLPAAVLLELSRERGVSRAKTYEGGAKRLLEFLRGCRGLCSSQSAHVVAYAAALAKDKPLADIITKSLLSAAGKRDAEIDYNLDAMDQAAETFIWLSQASKV